VATKDISDRQVCEAYAEMGRQRQGAVWRYQTAEELLMQSTGQCLKVCLNAMQRAENRRLIDCGVSLRTGWLTDAGKALLNGDAAR